VPSQSVASALFAEIFARCGERLMQTQEFAGMFAEAREAKLQQLVRTFTGEPGELNAKLCMNVSFDPADAAQALEKARAHYAANPDDLHADAQILSLDNAMRLRALRELISTKLSPYLDRLHSPGPERTGLQQRLGSRHTDEEFDAALNRAGAQIMGDLERFARNLTTADFIVVDHVIAKHLESRG
jgi:hypothetical protein